MKFGSFKETRNPYKIVGCTKARPTELFVWRHGMSNIPSLLCERLAIAANVSILWEILVFRRLK